MLRRQAVEGRCLADLHRKLRHALRLSVSGHSVMMEEVARRVRRASVSEAARPAARRYGFDAGSAASVGAGSSSGTIAVGS